MIFKLEDMVSGFCSLDHKLFFGLLHDVLRVLAEVDAGVLLL